MGARVYANQIGIKIDKLRGELHFCAGNLLLVTQGYENGRDYSQSSSADKEILSTIRRAVTSLLCELWHLFPNSQSSDVVALTFFRRYKRSD